MKRFRNCKIILAGMTIALAGVLLSSCGGGGDKSPETTDSTSIPTEVFPAIVTMASQAPSVDIPVENQAIPPNDITVGWDEEVIDPPKRMRVSMDETPELNVRNGPGGAESGYKIVAKLPNEYVITVDKKVTGKDWYRIQGNGYYVSSTYLVEVSDVPPIIDPDEIPGDEPGDEPVTETAPPAP